MYINPDRCCDVELPSAFSPNGDGRNDLFRPITIGHHKLKIFRVVNRYGQTVYESNVESNGWDGRFGGVPQDMGTYFYYLNYDCNGKTIEKKGDVTLIR
jgi:gliding motility-associated-like protein